MSTSLKITDTWKPDAKAYAKLKELEILRFKFEARMAELGRVFEQHANELREEYLAKCVEVHQA